MDGREKELRDRVAAVSPDGFIDPDEEREMASWAAGQGLGTKFDSITTDECLKNNIVRANTAKGQFSKYIETNYGMKKLSKKEVEAITHYAKTLIPTGNGNPDEAWAQLKELVVDPQLEGRIKTGNPLLLFVVILIALGAIGAAVYFSMLKKPDVKIVTKTKYETVTKVVGPEAKQLSPEEKQKADMLIVSMKSHIEQGLYTDPPEDCAKGDLDAIRVIDPDNTYKKVVIDTQISIIIDKYLQLAKKSYMKEDVEKTEKWIKRAKLFYKESEVIREFEREIGLIANEH